MSTSYRAVGWNRQKQRYDGVIGAGVGGYLVVFVLGGLLIDPNATIETLIIRACGTAAALLLHVVLAIGPLCRLDSRFLPLLYNRRHLGVTTFLIRGFDPIEDAFHYGRDLLPRVRALVAERDREQTRAAAAE